MSTRGILLFFRFDDVALRRSLLSFGMLPRTLVRVMTFLAAKNAFTTLFLLFSEHRVNAFCFDFIGGGSRNCVSRGGSRGGRSKGERDCVRFAVVMGMRRRFA
jgi:hypothetical protein